MQELMIWVTVFPMSMQMLQEKDKKLRTTVTQRAPV